MFDLTDLLDYITSDNEYYLFYDDSKYSYTLKEKKNQDMVLPKIIHENKNNIYVAKFPNGKKEVDILKPNHNEPFDLEKGLLYYVIKHNLNLSKVLEWMKPILDENQNHQKPQDNKKKIEAKINNWLMTKNDNPINDKDCQKVINNKEFIIDDKQYLLKINIQKNGIVSVYDKKNNEYIKMIKNGFPYKGFLRHLVYTLYNFGNPKIEYYQFKKLTYRFYKECFDSIEKQYKKSTNNVDNNYS